LFLELRLLSEGGFSFVVLIISISMNTIATNWRAMPRAAMLLALFLLAGTMPGSILAQGRVSNYTIQNFSEAYTSIGGSLLSSGGDDYQVATSLPFAFNYDNNSISSGSTIYLNSNGFISFGSLSTSQYSNMVGLSTFPNAIAWASEDLYVNYSGSASGGIYVSTTGSSPNRIFNIEYKNISHYSTRTGTGPFIDVTIRLKETSNIIEILYSQLGVTFYNSSSDPIGVGLNGSSSSFVSKLYQAAITVPSSHVRFLPPVPPGQQLSVQPKSINFGNISAGNSSPNVPVTVTNSGVRDNLIINAATISGTADFTIVSSPASNVLAPGTSATYLLKFQPLAAGTRSATFSVSSNGVDSGSQQVSLSGFGLAPAVEYSPETALFRKTRTRLGETISQKITVKSTGQGPLNITGLNITGDYANMYTVTRKLGGPLAPGVTDTLTVTYSPTEEGLRGAVLNITTDALQNPNKTITLNGLGIVPHLIITPTAVRFDSVAMGDTAWTTLRLYNSGSDTLAVKADYVTYFDRDFAYFGLEGADSLIAPEKFRDVQVRFTPQSQGARQGRVRFLTNIPLTFEPIRRDTSTFIVDVTGTAVPYGLISITGPTKPDSSIIGNEVCQTVKIWNNGQSPLTVMSATISGADAADFRISGVTYPATIAPQSSIDAQVCGTPSSRGLRTAMIDVVSFSNEKTTTTQLALAVYGLEVCAQSSTNIAFENEIIHVGENGTAQIMINNCGDVATAYTGVVAGAGYTLTSAGTTGVIAPGDNATFDISFNPTVMGSAAGTLTVTGNGVTPIVISLAGIGGDVMIAAQNNTAPETGVGLTSNEFTVTVKNNGNMDLTPGDPVISNSEFTYVAGSGPSTIAAGATGNYKFTFTPAAQGGRSASVTFPSASPALSGGFMLNGNGITNAVRQTAQNGYALNQNYPNPFNPSTVITFTMAEGGNAQIIVSDMTGNVVATAANQYFNKGENTVTFDASQLASGTYFYELVANGVRLQRAMLLNK
jgi:hypothetical protein